MWTLTCVSLLVALVSASPASPVGLRGAVDRPVQAAAGIENASVVEAVLPAKVGSNVSKASQRQLQEDPWDKYSQEADQVSAGVDAFSDAFAMVDDTSWQTAGKSVASIGSLVAVSVPPPAGIVAGGVMGLVGGLMSIFGPHKPPGPSNTDIMNAMNDGFQHVMNALGDIAVDIEHLTTMVTDVQKQLDELLLLTHEIYTSTVLQGSNIKQFLQEYADLSKAYIDAQTDSILFDDYKKALLKIKVDYSYLHGSIGPLGSSNLAAMLEQVAASFENNPRDYDLVTQQVALYRWFYQARTSLFSALMQASTLEHGNFTSQTLDYIDTFVQDVKGYEEVLKDFKLGKAVSFSDSHASACAATANSVMQMQGLSLEDFMHPYIYLTHGDCSHPVGLDGPPWNVPPGFDFWPGHDYYGSDVTLGMLLDVESSECDASLFWDGRSMITNLNDKQVYTDYSTTTASQLKFQWLGSCPSGVAPWVQMDEPYLQNPGCGCRIYADPTGVMPSLPMCRNTCYA